MIMKIVTNYKDEIIEVTLPISIKNNFKSVFKTAKWNNAKKVWEIKNSTISKNKLKKWIELVEENKLDTNLQEFDEIELTTKEIQQIERHSREIKEFLESSIRRNGCLDEILEEKREKEEELNNLKNKLDKEKEEIKRKEEELKKFVDGLIDIEKVKDLHYKLINARKYYNRQVYNDLKGELWEMHEKFKESGFYIPDLDNIHYANYNRPERDIIEDMNMFYDIKKIQEEEEEED